MAKVLAIKYEADGIITCTHEPYLDGRLACELAAYATGHRHPHYPVPAIPTKVHYVYQPGNWVGNGVLIRVRGVVKAGAWADGLPMEPLPNWVCQFCGGMDHSEDCCPM